MRDAEDGTVAGGAAGLRPSVFISYARADRPRVVGIADALQARGYTIWWDALIDGGAAFARTIETNLAQADAVIVVWSSISVESDWVRDEAAHGRDRKRLVPISLDGTPPPLGFGQYHAVDFTAWKDGRDPRVLDALERAIALAAGHAPADHARTPARAGLSRRTLFAAGSGVVALGAVGAVAGFGWFGATAVNDHSIAVLPFRNLSADPAQAYFSDGLSEDVRSALVRASGLKVAALSSSRLASDDADDKAIARRLGVAFLLEGSVRKAGDMVRIAATLIDGRSGFSSWSQTFDRRLDDVLAVQSEIAETVAAAFALKLKGTPDVTGATRSASAYDASLQGRALFNLDGGEASDRAALAQFDTAIARDPAFALAHAQRARALAAIASSYAKASELRPLYAAAQTAAERAVALAPGLPDAQLALGLAILSGQLDFARAKAAYDRAATLGAGNADILLPCALFAARCGKASDAQRMIDRAIDLDPINPRVFRAQSAILLEARHFAEAIPPMRHALSLNPKLSLANAGIGTAQLMLGKTAAARDAFGAEQSAQFRLAGLAITDHRAGDEPGAREALQELVTTAGDSALYQQAQILAQFGRTAAALDALERAYRVLDAGLTSIRNDPMLDPLRAQPRFTHLLGAMGIA